MEEILHGCDRQTRPQAVIQFNKKSQGGLKDPKRPIGSFMFLGPTGVKRPNCAGPGCALFGDEDAMVRIDMSEYP